MVCNIFSRRRRPETAATLHVVNASRTLLPSALLPFPDGARAGDWVSCVGFDDERALFMSTPNEELGPRVVVDLITVVRPSGAIAASHRLTFEDDWFASLSFRGGCAITRRGHLLSLADGEIRRTLSLGDPEGRSFWTFASDGLRFLGAHRVEGKWIYSVHDTKTGAEQSRATGAAPMMVYPRDDLSSIVVVGTGRHVARAWQTANARMSIVAIPVRGEPIFTPDLSRWMVWTPGGGISVGDLGGETRTSFELPAELASAGIRYDLGNESLALSVLLGEDLRVVVIDLASGRVNDELHLPEAAGPSARPYLDRAGRRVLFLSREGVCAWRIGSMEYHRVAGAISGMNLVSSVAGASPWTSSGFYLVREENTLAFYE